MKRKGVQEVPAADRLAPAANEEFATPADELERLGYCRSGWDPYEVWRTRVKSSSRAKTEGEGDPLR
jgi:hypothetical protein